MHRHLWVKILVAVRGFGAVALLSLLVRIAHHHSKGFKVAILVLFLTNFWTLNSGLIGQPLEWRGCRGELGQPNARNTLTTQMISASFHQFIYIRKTREILNFDLTRLLPNKYG
jgi:hypothetical protein